MNITNLLKKIKIKTANIQIRKATKEDVSQIYSLIESIYNLMDNKSWYSYTKNIERYNIFINDGYCYVAVFKGKIIGYFLTYILKEDGTNLYKLLNDHYGNSDNIIEVINFGVLPDFRGFGLQKKMMLRLEKDLKDSKFKKFVCTVHPDNKYSLNNMLDNGYEIVMTTKLYGGLDRHVIVKNIYK